MGKEFTIMKTTLFGGFKKSDVLAYVEQLQTETAEVKEELDSKREESLELKRRIDELEVKLENLLMVGDKLAIKEKEVADLTVKLELALSDKAKLQEKIDEYDEKSEKLRRAEKQIGAAYIDARRYSEDIVDTAKSKAKDIGAMASQDVKREALEIESLLKEVDDISRKFNTSIEQLHKDVYALSTKLNISASTLLNLHTDLTGIEELGLDLDGDVENDFSVVTYSEHIDADDNDNVNTDLGVDETEEG